MKEIKKNKKDKFYYCFKFKCRKCPRQRECEEEEKTSKKNKKESSLERW